MEQEKINRYVDNLGINEQVDLLKRILYDLFVKTQESDFNFIKEQIEEFNEKFPEPDMEDLTGYKLSDLRGGDEI